MEPFLIFIFGTCFGFAMAGLLQALPSAPPALPVRTGTGGDEFTYHYDN